MIASAAGDGAGRIETLGVPPVGDGLEHTAAMFTPQGDGPGTGHVHEGDGDAGRGDAGSIATN